MSFGESWAYSDSINWKKDYPASKGKNQSPINIDKKKALTCDLLCDMSLKYNDNSNCVLTVKNRTPIIYFNSGNNIKYVATKEVLSLKAMTIHTPSLHTINGIKYDMEVILYHKLSGGLNPKSKNFVPGGTAISILFQKGSDHGEANNFFNSFVYRIPNDKDSTNGNIDVDVGDNWSPKQILPETKSYFYYEGSLPFPPCEENWKWHVFEEIQSVSPHILEVLRLGFRSNIRPLKSLGERKVSYNSKIDFTEDLEFEKEVKTQNITLNSDKSSMVKEANNMPIFDKKIVKILITAILIILTVYASLKMTKYIISNDLVNKILVPSRYIAELQKKRSIASKMARK